MSAIRLVTAADVLEFQTLVDALSTSHTGYTLDLDALQDEIGRFRVWCGNIGALQKGHSSLDYRLRDSPLLSSNVLKLLQELKENITAAVQITSGTRLPYEKQQQQPNDSDEDEDDDFFSDDDEEDDGPGAPKTELEMRFREVQDVIDNLYKLSVRIRQPTIRTRSLKAAAFAPKDPETQVDLMEQYAISDLQHIQELVRHLRMSNVKKGEGEAEDDGVLIGRFARAVTLRRRQFKYWKRHRDKLGAATIHEEPVLSSKIDRPEVLDRQTTLEVQIGDTRQAIVEDAPSQRTGKTLLSGTEATRYHQTLDEIVDSRSVTSYATTVRDATGRSIQLPPPSKNADGQRDFECPVCYIICPSRYASQRAWKTHVLQDLQPYVCTYPECPTPDQLFQSRRQWVEHETSHRKVWRCPEHPDAVFKTSSGLSDHLQQAHGDSIPKNQLENIIKVGETSTIDSRACPICCATTESHQIANHIANHLERMAAFALPTSFHEDSDGASSQASGGRTESKDSEDLSELTFSSTSNGDAKGGTKLADTLGSPSQVGRRESSRGGHEVPSAEYGLSAELLREVPNATQNRLGILFTQTSEQAHRTTLAPPSPVGSQSPESEDENDGSSMDSDSQILYDEIGEEGTNSTVPILTTSELPTLHSLYQSGELSKGDAEYPPNGTFNQLVSFYVYDITRLRVDAIVNSGNRTLTVSRPEFTLNRKIHIAGGPGLTRECKSHGKINIGEAALTGGYKLPCSQVIHVARPNNEGRTEDQELLASCYYSALELAMRHGIQTIAFPLLGSGGCGFPLGLATRIALKHVRMFLNGNPSHPFTSIIFCPFTNSDAMSYLKNFPIYFPPTHDEIANVVPEYPNTSRAVLAKSVLDANNQVEAVIQEVKDFRRHIAAFPGDVLLYLTSISHALSSLRVHLPQPRAKWLGLAVPGSYLSPQRVADINLICAVMRAFSDSITEVMEIARVKAESGQLLYQAIWNEYDQHMKTTQRLNVVGLLELCHDFVHGLKNVVISNDEVPHEMSTIYIRLNTWLAKTTGSGQDDIQQHFDEIIYQREYQQDAAVPRRTEVIKLHQVPTLSHLYQTGGLHDPRISPTSDFNDTICFINHDITRLEVDIIVNSTDPTFTGTGQLDSTIFERAGLGMFEELRNLGICQEGDVKSTGAYELPSKHVLHAIPPETYRTTSKDILRRIYREILRQAEVLKATSIAIPALCTGILNYPRQDCATLAMEEVHNFLVGNRGDSTLEKIIFCVYSSSDEYVYKSLLPSFFPPTRHDTIHLSSAKQPIIPYQRTLREREKNALIDFEGHAETCSTCVEVMKVYMEGGNLCLVGYGLAQVVLQHLNMDSNQTVFSTHRVLSERIQVEMPQEFPLGREMLTAVERSLRDPNRNTSFVSPTRPWPGLAEYQKDPDAPLPGATIHEALFKIPNEPEKAHAFVCIWSEEDQIWRALHRHACEIHIFPGKMQVHKPVNMPTTQAPLLYLELTPEILVERTSFTEFTIENARLLHGSVGETGPKILLRCTSSKERDILYQMVMLSTSNHSTYNVLPAGVEAGMESSEAQQPRTLDENVTASTDNIPAKPNEEEDKMAPLTIPTDMWVCGLCYQGAAVVHTRCPDCGHERDGLNYWPGETLAHQHHEDTFVFLSSIILYRLRKLDKGEGLYARELAAQTGVTDATLTQTIQQLWENNRIHPTPGKTGAWSATLEPTSKENRSDIEASGAQGTGIEQRRSLEENVTAENSDATPKNLPGPSSSSVDKPDDLSTSVSTLFPLGAPPDPPKPRPNSPEPSTQQP